jgi:hypothetical protein
MLSRYPADPGSVRSGIRLVLPCPRLRSPAAKRENPSRCALLDVLILVLMAIP